MVKGRQGSWGPWTERLPKKKKKNLNRIDLVRVGGSAQLPASAAPAAAAEEEEEAAAAAAAAMFVTNFPRSVTCARHDRCEASELAERICTTLSLGSGA